MLFDNIFAQNSIMETSMQASMLRNDVILNNIANAETPGFKKRTVEFENILSNALQSAKFSNGMLDLESLKPKVNIMHSNYSYRLDGNNVDIETEMVDLYENSVRYDAMVSGVMNNYKKISLVLSGK